MTSDGKAQMGVPQGQKDVQDDWGGGEIGEGGVSSYLD